MKIEISTTQEKANPDVERGVAFTIADKRKEGKINVTTGGRCGTRTRKNILGVKDLFWKGA